MADDTSAMVSDPVMATRAHVESAARSLLGIEDAAWGRPWEWRGSRQSIRFAFYRVHEVLEETQAELAPEARWTPGAALAGRATAARWALHGTVLPHAGLLDAPAGDEWTLREVLSHVVQAQDFWAWLSGHWVELLAAGQEIPASGYVREAVPAHYRGEREPVAGTLDEIRAELDQHLDASLANLLEVERRGALDVPVSFQRAEVPIRFYPARWSAHLREHTNQAEKTVPLTGRQPREVELVLRLLLRAYGELEATAMAVPESVAAPILETAGLGISRHAQEIAETAAG